ncbi:ubiquitin carboxyl-terminal hydrolase 38-like isoform X1 [Haliotis asinina]|uniref:ubiquitin carboxyl-terminal hydrolase 38-like isoform X1 n=2 Tax=Haliotis asinina TaxID=109174 RepID=UPI00353202D5
MGTWLKKHKYKLNHDLDNMDRILQGIISSNHPERMKKELIDAVAVKGQKQAPSVISCVLELAAGWTLNGESELVVTSGFKVYIEWAKTNMASAEAFFNREYLVNLLSGKYRNEANVPILLHENMRLLKDSATAQAHFKVIEAKAISYVQEHTDLKCLNNFIVFLEDFKECIPKGDFTSKFCVTILQAMSMATIPETAPEMITFVKDATRIGNFLHYIWSQNNKDCIMDSLRTIFSIISTPDDLDPCFCLGAVVSFIPLDMASSVVKNAISDPIIDDFSMTSAVQRMIDWLTWPTVKNIDQWVIMFLKELAAAKKYTILITVTDNKVEQVAEKLQYAPLREASYNILAHMLLSFQHAPEPFHKILPMMPRILQAMKQDLSSESQHYFIRTVELLHTLMQLHAGFPDLYDPILDAVKGYPKPSSEAVRIMLEEKRWNTAGVSGLSPSLKISERSDTGKTGLFNLGNTCYMNSILQALYISDEFRQNVLSHTVCQGETLMAKLQQVFAFLSLSQRPAYAPMQFLQASRPPWFTPGFQQDCSEFLKFLLDQLHEQQLKVSAMKIRKKEEKTSTLSKKFSRKSQKVKEVAEEKEVDPTLVQNIFGGNMCTTFKCLNCKNQSSRTESFTDIPLAFPEYPQSKQKSLAGGNSADARLNKDTIRADPEVESTSSDGSLTNGLQTGLDLSDLVDHYLQPEKLIGDNKYFCEKCRGLQEGERSIRITKSPENLILTLLRFSYDAKLQSRSKIFREVRYPKTIALPIDNCCDSDGSADPQQTKRQRTLPTIIEQKLCGNRKTGHMAIYGLTAVIVHSGTSSECGHYYCYARHSALKSMDTVCDEVQLAGGEGDIDFMQEKWYLCNDSRVSYANYNSFSTVSKRFMKDTPYVLMYRRIDMDTSSTQERDSNLALSPLQLDPPIRQDLRMAVSKDNQAYLQEQETAAKAKQAKRDRTSSTSSVTLYNWKDEEQDPPDNCGGGGFGSLDTSGSRFVF